MLFASFDTQEQNTSEGKNMSSGMIIILFKSASVIYSSMYFDLFNQFKTVFFKCDVRESEKMMSEM